MKAHGRRIGVVIPAYQAAPSVGEVVTRTLAIVEELVVVDDGSRDGTGEAARDAGALVLHHSENLGKGRALRTGMEELFGRGVDAVVTLDADGQHLAEEIPALLACLPAEPDLVLGVRDRHFAKMCRLRRASNCISSRLISFAAGQSLSDVQTGFRLYTRALFETIGLRGSGFEAESAVVVRAARRGLRIVMTPIELGFADGRCTSHYRALRDSLRIASAVVRARFEIRR